MKKIVALLIYLLFLLQTIFAVNLAQISLEEASNEELSLMCELRSIVNVTTREEMIESLMQQFSIEYPNSEDNTNSINPVDQNDLASQLNFNIENSNSLEMISEDTSLIILSGDVRLSFQENDDSKRTLSAQKIIIDINNNNLVAFSGVSFINNDTNENLISQEILGDIVSYNWENNKILVSDANISTQRKNSDNENVVFNATSSLMSLDTSNNTLILNDGFITTNPDNAYSSISASKLALLNHGDMYVENAKLSIGRINVLYLPFFFSPGAKMIGNPAMGYDTTRGTFVNTTFEIIGKYPNFATTSESSFNTFLKTDNSQDKYADGAIYNSTLPDNDLAKWANSTNSYFTLFLDAYSNTPDSIDSDEKGSIVVGYDLQFNLINKALVIESNALTSFASDGISTNLTNYSDYPIFRYDINYNAQLKLKNGNINLNVPLISDPKVRKAYGNRLSTFNLDSLWNSTQSFPTNYSSDITSYNWYLNAKYKLNSELLSPYISQINLESLETQIDYKWKSLNSNYSYYVDKITFPSIDLSINGTLIDLSSNKNVETTKNEETPKSQTTDLPLLDQLYKSSYTVDEKSTYGSSSLNMSYNLSENLYYQENINEETKNLYNKSIFNLNTDGNLEPNIIKIDNNIKLQYILSSDINEEEDTSLSVKTSNIINLPFLNLYYYFDSILYTFDKTVDSDGVTQEINTFEFSDDFISKHQIEWKNTYNIFDLRVTPSLAFVLPPLSLALKPSLLLNYNTLSNNTVFTFDIDSNNFDLTNIDNYFDYSIGDFTFSIDTNYDVANSLVSTRFLDSLILDTSAIYYNRDNNQYLAYSSKYYGLYDDSIENYFSRFNFTYRNSFLNSKINFYTNSDTNQLELDYFKNTITLSNFEKYWWKNRIGLKLDIDATFNYSFVDKYSTYFSLESNLKFRIAEFMLINFSIKTSNYNFYTYYDSNNNFSFSDMFSDLLSSFDFFNGGRSSTQFNLEEVSLDFVHMMEDWDLHCKYNGSVVLSDYKYQWVPSVSIFLQWKTLPELNVDRSFDL